MSTEPVGPSLQKQYALDAYARGEISLDEMARRIEALSPRSSSGEWLTIVVLVVVLSLPEILFIGALLLAGLIFG